MCQAGIDCPGCPSPRPGRTCALRLQGAGLPARCAARLKDQGMKGSEQGRCAVSVRGAKHLCPGPVPFPAGRFRNLGAPSGPAGSGSLAKVTADWPVSAGPGVTAMSRPPPQCPMRGISRFQTAAPDWPRGGRTPAGARGSRSPFQAGPEHSGCFCLPGSRPQGPRPADA